MTNKKTFSVDRSNRLVITKGSLKLKPRGSFSIGKHNSLIYTINEPRSWVLKQRLDSQIRLEGSWKLTPEHDLELTLNESKEKLVLNGRLISCDTDSFVFEIATRESQSTSQISILRLTGSWQNDEKNRLVFTVQKNRTPDTLTLESAWHVDAHNRIVYTFSKTDLKRKQNIRNSILFEGHWQLTGPHQLTYLLERSLHSGFRFRAQLESPTIRAQKGVLKYRIGAGLEESGLQHAKTITLYGAWRFSNALTLDFDISYTKGKIKGLGLNARYAYTRKDSVAFGLNETRNTPLTYTITFTHRFLKKLDAHVYAILTRSKAASGFKAGIEIPF